MAKRNLKGETMFKLKSPHMMMANTGMAMGGQHEVPVIPESVIEGLLKKANPDGSFEAIDSRNLAVSALGNTKAFNSTGVNEDDPEIAKKILRSQVTPATAVADQLIQSKYRHQPFTQGGQTFREIDPDETIDLREHPNAKFVTVPRQKRPLTDRERMEQEMNRAGGELRLWEHMPPVLQPNDCTRLHRMFEYLTQALDDQDRAQQEGAEIVNRQLRPFVVKHDWLAAFGESLGTVTDAELKIPYPITAFEFRITGHTVIVLVYDKTIDQENVGVQCCVEASNGAWKVYSNGDDSQVDPLSIAPLRFAMDQVRAICVMLDARIAETTVVNQPAKLQAKRERQGKRPLADYHVIDLSSRYRATARPDPVPTGRRVRCHFRRGHYVHADDRPKADASRHAMAQRWEAHDGRWRTWVNWMLVGDPDLGFVNSEYRL